ncbi:Extended synaptotagmin-3 isoform A [Micractinium conductrix]|uniref:Extended synaptotagmin-3 isoform A n=1 Tax=Micractinium conductrix TaxID=554055 RepID=A0A2P6V1U5_9CHLO|nr:Extended synaptotagmin-3 isoform A [Micractinium conductrix]|eukprot:PSC68066.1 Extended synaptotagmin-3 isoform A [Micractinium conductrix]
MAALDGHGEDGGALGGGALAAAAAPAAPHLPPSGGSSALGGFLAGAALVLVLGALAWRRWRTSNRRELHRQRQHAALRELSAMDAQELRQLLGGLELPSWAVYPDHQRVAWLNTVVKQLWPFAARCVCAWAEEAVPGLLLENKPAWMRSIKLKHFSMGTVPPEPLGVKVFGEGETRSDEVTIDIDFTWPGEQEIALVARPVPKAANYAVTRLPGAAQIVDLLSNTVVIKASMERLTLQGRLRVMLRPLISQVPLIGAVQVAFTQVPSFSFDLTVLGGDASLLPGLEAWMNGMIKDTLLQPFVLPERLVIPMVDTASPGFDRPRGVLQVQVIEAHGVPRMDMFSKSDPYVELFVIENDHRPHWDESFTLLVHYPDTQLLTARLVDYDPFDADDEIGRVELPLKELRGRSGADVDAWYDVEPPHQAQPAAAKYFTTAAGPIAAGVKVGQKAIGMLIRPWEVRQLLPGKKGRKKKCRLHLKLSLLEFEDEEVQVALEEQRGPGAGDMYGGSRPRGNGGRHIRPAVRKALQGGVLVLRVLRVESLAGKPVLLGGWTHSVQVRVWFAGQGKRTRTVRGRRFAYSVDQELEFVIGGDAAQQPHNIEVEVWDMHWRNTFQGRASVPLRAVRDAQLWRNTLELEGVQQGRISLEAQWLPASSPQLAVLRMDQACLQLMSFGQLFIIARQWHSALSAGQRAHLAFLTLLFPGFFMVTLLCPRAYWRHRLLAMACFSVGYNLLPNQRQTAVGPPLALERPAQPGVPGAFADLLRAFVGTRVLTMTICGVAILLPPAPTVVLQCLVALLTFNGPAFCATQLLAHPLTRARMKVAAAAVELLSLPFFAVQPAPAAAAAPGGDAMMDAAPGSADEEALCRACSGFFYTTLCVLLPTVVSVACWRLPLRDLALEAEQAAQQAAACVPA